MLIGRVKGTVVSTNKVDKLTGAKLLIVQPVDIETFEEKGEYVICIDDVGAGDGDIVMCAYGSSARQTDTSKQYASDYSVYGIVDYINIKEKQTYDKAKDSYGSRQKEKETCN